MAITPRQGVSSADMVTRWQAGMRGGGARWAARTKTPRTLPNADPAGNTANWQSGVAAAAPAFAAGISSPNYLTKLEAGLAAGQSKFQASADSRLPEVQSAFPKVATMVQNALANLPKKGPRGTNTARSTAFQDAMRAQRGQGKSS